MEPYPEIIYPIEYTSAKVTCVAYDQSGEKVPDMILFLRRDGFNNYVNLTDDGNLYFTNRTEGRKGYLIVTREDLFVGRLHLSINFITFCHPG